MSRVDEFIKEKCPDGVEYKCVGEVIQSLKTGLNPRQSFVLNEAGANLFYVTGKDIKNNSICISEKTDLISQDVVNLINKRANLEVNDVLFVSTGTGTVGRMAVVSEYNNDWAVSETMFCLKPKKEIVLARYLMHILYTRAAILQYEPKISKGSVPHLKVNDLLDVKIPVPPIEVQQEIVRVLDKFTELEAELQAELDGRKKQYEHYRNQLFTFGEEIPFVTFPEISVNCDKKRKPITGSQREKGDIPYYGASGVVDYVKDYIFDGDYLLISEDGANLTARVTPIAFSISGKTWVNNHAHVLRFDTDIDRKFIEYYLNSIDLSYYITGAAQPKLNQENLNKIPLPNPSYEVKKRFVEILDEFSTICESEENGLPAEIEARHKQYEYYRDKLLTFERKAV